MFPNHYARDQNLKPKVDSDEVVLEFKILFPWFYNGLLLTASHNET
jgi:hypothetical protein